MSVPRCDRSPVLSASNLVLLSPLPALFVSAPPAAHCSWDTNWCSAPRHWQSRLLCLNTQPEGLGWIAPQGRWEVDRVKFDPAKLLQLDQVAPRMQQAVCSRHKVYDGDWSVSTTFAAKVAAAFSIHSVNDYRYSIAQIHAALYRQMGRICVIDGDTDDEEWDCSALWFAAVQANCPVPAHVRAATRDMPRGQKAECAAVGGIFQPLMTAVWAPAARSRGSKTRAGQDSNVCHWAEQQAKGQAANFSFPPVSVDGYAELLQQIWVVHQATGTTDFSHFCPSLSLSLSQSGAGLGPKSARVMSANSQSCRLDLGSVSASSHTHKGAERFGCYIPPPPAPAPSP